MLARIANDCTHSISHVARNSKAGRGCYEKTTTLMDEMK